MQVLLDVTDTEKRRVQTGAALAGIMLIALGLLVVLKTWQDPLTPVLGGLAELAGLFALFYSLRMKQQWQVSYKNHFIRLENEQFRGERLLIDGEIVARSGLGMRIKLQGRIRNGDGMGDWITAETVAGFLSFRCRITAQPAGAPLTTAD